MSSYKILANVLLAVAVEKGNELISKTPRKGSCCRCFESEVDSLLYRYFSSNLYLNINNFSIDVLFPHSNLANAYKL